MIAGISHITFIVKDLQRTTVFLEQIFGAKEIYSSATAKYFLIHDLWIALNQGEPLSERTYNHIAFTIPDSDFDGFVARIKEVGAEIIQGRTRLEGEGRSIYFYDYDNHLFELHSGALSERLDCYVQDE
ncbi:MAG: VOC family protein [Oscillospiraceae bacterium]|nr:VOC family protein [Oscillospiraceae bacterium]